MSLPAPLKQGEVRKKVLPVDSNPLGPLEIALGETHRGEDGIKEFRVERVSLASSRLPQTPVQSGSVFPIHKKSPELINSLRVEICSLQICGFVQRAVAQFALERHP
jgi:hypothetical protein